MLQSTIFTVISALFLTVLGVPTSSDNQLEARRTYAGRGTWFNDGLGACGLTNKDSDIIVALPVDEYDRGAHCNQWVKITNIANGKTAYGLVRDECPGCGQYGLDMSIGLFEKLGDLNTGVLSIDWNFMPKGFSP
ncbi:hypothetical protein OG21DRAFT_1508695 [Imleria badia]|nr:hypothetical protein OG21DRAFT_1508695 [Imleria badia]